MTSNHSIATNTAYTEILAQNHESYLQLRRQQRTILSLARTTRRDPISVPSFSRRFKTRYVPLTKRALIHSVPLRRLTYPALHKAFSAPSYHDRLNGRRRRGDARGNFRYKTLRAKKRPAELLPKPTPAVSASAQVSGVSVPASDASVPVSNLSVLQATTAVSPASPADPVALCISNLQPDSDNSERVTFFGYSVSSRENATGKILSYAEYWLESSKTELRKLKLPLKKAQKVVKPSSFKRVRGLIRREKPHVPEVVRAQPKETESETSGSADSAQAPRAPPATGATGSDSARLVMMQNSRNLMALQRSSACASGHSESDECLVCHFLERANLQRMPSPESGILVRTAPGRMMPRSKRLALPTAEVSREAGITIVQQVLDYVKAQGSELYRAPGSEAYRLAQYSTQYSQYTGTSAVSKHVAHDPALAALIGMLLETFQNLPQSAVKQAKSTKVSTAKYTGGGTATAEDDGKLSSLEEAETNPEANFANQVVPSIFGRNYLVLSPISSFDGTFSELPEVPDDCGFLGTSRLLKQVRFFVDDEFNARDLPVTWIPESRYNSLGLLRDSGLRGYLMELGGSDETLVLQTAGANAVGDTDNFSEFGYQMLSTGVGFDSVDLLDSGYYTASSKA